MPAKKLKVFFIPAWYPSRVDKLAGIFIERHAQALSKACDVSVFYVCADKELKRQFEWQLSEENGIGVLRVYFKKGIGSSPVTSILDGIKYGIAAMLGYRRAVKVFGRPDINHVHVLTRAAVWPMVLRWFVRIPYVITEHWSRYLREDNSYSGFVRKRVTEMAVQFSSGISVVSDLLRKSMRNQGLDHGHFVKISNVVDTDLFRPQDVEKPGLPCFIHVSSFHPNSKNVKGIIDAAFLADKENLKFVLYLVGDGNQKKVLEEYVAGLGFKNVVIIFTGELQGQELVSCLWLADCFILFSYYENQPCVVLESFSCGVPVIGSNAGGVPELITEDSGLLVEPANPLDLKNAIKLFIEGKVSFDKNHLRDKALQNYSYEVVCSKFVDFYKTALDVAKRK